MLFNSIEFLFFFPTVVAGYFVLPHRHRWWWLLVASAAFYMAFVPKYILILAFTIAVDYVAGLLIAQAAGLVRKLYLALSIIANVGVLCVFKYWHFLRENVGALTSALSMHNPLPPLAIVLPIGLSFHTFQAMSYTIEVYRGRQTPERHLGIYSLYVMYFPQLVAGPIERPQNLLPQFHEKHSFDYERIVSGLQMMAVGFVKKAVADRLAVLGEGADVWTAPLKHSSLELAIAIVFFTFRIYYDFSGYSDIALGSSRVLGIELMKNFDLPYASRSIGEFWRRWHISLSTWFRDYVYIPLGGSRVGRWEHYRNLLVVFGLSGIWHGANWTFAVWGLLHACYLIFGQATRAARTQAWRWLGLEHDSLPRRWIAELTTFLAVALGWVFFRAPSVRLACDFLTRLVTSGAMADINVSARNVAMGLALIASLTLFERTHRQKSVFIRARQWPFGLRYALYFALVYTGLFLPMADTNVQFIYFQF